MTANDDINIARGRVLIKHTMSCARDAMVSYVIDWPEKVVTVAMRTYSGQPFVAAGFLQDFVAHILTRRHDIHAYDDDNAAGWTPARTDWTVLLDVGGQRFRVRLIKQIALGDQDRWALELDAEETTP